MSNPSKIIEQLIEVLLAAEKTLHTAESLQAEAAVEYTEATAALHDQLKELVALAGLADRGAEARAVANQQQLTAVEEKFAGQLQGFSEQLNAVIEASTRSVTDSLAAEIAANVTNVTSALGDLGLIVSRVESAAERSAAEIGTSTELFSSMPEKTAALQGEQLRKLETSVVKKVAKTLEKTLSNDLQQILEFTKNHSLQADKELQEEREIARKYKDQADLLSASLASSDSQRVDLEQLLADANKRLEVEAQANVAQQHEFREAQQKLEDREYHLVLTQQHLADREQELAGQIGQLQSKISDMEFLLSERNSEVAALRRSFSWRLMALPRFVVEVVLVLPVRGIKKLYSTLFRRPAEVATETLTAEHEVPSDTGNVDGSSALPETGASREAADATGATLTTVVRRDPYAAETEGSVFVEKTTDGPVDTSSLAARVIALYLPQYHQIPENDAWWGEGFTEWVKVKAAKPIYEGHKQPLLPHDDIGFYDLSDADVMRRQADLARLYGISGFCIYFYWFAGKTLLEKPLQNLLANPDIDMPFMLCWANENWTRTWDGLSNNVLISQEHSPEDDLQFISHISQYLVDPRYIRVDGKPVIVLYRPDLLPDVCATAQRWRSWCRENDVGELYLVTTWSFGKHNPEDFGFDASMEFTPNNTAPDKAPEPAGGRLNDFAGDLYDWISIAERSERYQEDDLDFTLFRTVNPGWDNTARRQHSGARFVGENPKIFRRWLKNSVVDANTRFAFADTRLVFVNAWNEWAEGAVLEPSAGLGYANLTALRDGAIEASREISLKPRGKKYASVAAVIHVFYPDHLPEILNSIDFSLLEKIYLTGPRAQLTTAWEFIRRSGVLSAVPVIAVASENRGRDVLPFLNVLTGLVDQFDYVLKVHTKKSPHRVDGDEWAKSLWAPLATNLKYCLDWMQMNNGAGMIAPVQHIVPMDYYWGANAPTVLRLAEQLGVEQSKTLQCSFVAGTMFLARSDCLKPLLSLMLERADFEDENGQLDGTMAHAVERIFGVATISIGKKIFGLTDMVELEAVDVRSGKPSYQYAAASPPMQDH